MTRVQHVHERARALAENFVALLELVEEIGREFTDLRREIEALEYREEHEPVEQRPRLDPGRFRSSPVSRMPRRQTDKLVRQKMMDRGWISGAELAAEETDDRVEFRYLRSSYQRSLKEGSQEGVYEHRRYSGTVERFGIGFIDQYRLKEEA
jgi:hypothetical protein